eukprot:1196268-Prorocentrum_minimum.AAC.6
MYVEPNLVKPTLLVLFKGICPLLSHDWFSSKALLERGADPLAKHKRSGRVALAAASAAGHSEAVCLLLDWPQGVLLLVSPTPG